MLNILPYTKIMNEEKVNIEWENCRIFDDTDIIQCFKCRGYNDKLAECRNKDIFCKCHGKHRSDKCNKENINIRINCIHMNKRLNLKLNENHVTLSKECQVYINKLNAKKRSVGLVA